MTSTTHSEAHSQDHTEGWTWVVDLLALVGAISPAVIYIGYLLTQ